MAIQTHIYSVYGPERCTQSNPSMLLPNKMVYTISSRPRYNRALPLASMWRVAAVAQLPMIYGNNTNT